MKTALVLSGGGARGAYEAGILYHLRKKVWKERHGFAIHSGTSAGAINSAFLAATAHTPKTQGEKLRELWSHLDSSNVYEGDFSALFHFLTRFLTFATSHLVGLAPLLQRWSGGLKPFHGLLDTRPFIPFLKKVIPFSQISNNIHQGPVDALSIGVTNVSSGKLELYIEKKETSSYTGAYRVHFGGIEWVHTMASAAVPLIFPPVRIGPYFYVDGSIRQNTPMSPAVQLGADRILIVGVKHRPTFETSSKFKFTEPNAYPTFTNMSGRLLNALFLDHIDYDLEQMTRINKVIEWGENVYGSDFLPNINQMLQTKGIQGDVANRGLKKIDSFAFFPSEDLGRIACEQLLALSRQKQKLSQVERFFLKFLEIDPKADLDLLSYFLFKKKYLQDLIDIGIKDCEAKEAELAKFLTNEDA